MDQRLVLIASTEWLGPTMDAEMLCLWRSHTYTTQLIINGEPCPIPKLSFQSDISFRHTDILDLIHYVTRYVRFINCLNLASARTEWRDP